jgi:hypothetical protein
MSPTKIIKTLKKQKIGLLLLILYIPVSCSVIGILAYYMKSPSILIESDSFRDVFWFYANPFNSHLGYTYLLTLLLSLAFLLLMILSTNTSRPIISIFQIRIVLLMLIAVITIFVMIFTVLMPLHYKPQYPLLLFLHVDVHLILVFLLTFLPIFRPLKKKLVGTQEQR